MTLSSRSQCESFFKRTPLLSHFYAYYRSLPNTRYVFLGKFHSSFLSVQKNYAKSLKKKVCMYFYLKRKLCAQCVSFWKRSSWQVFNEKIDKNAVLFRNWLAWPYNDDKVVKKKGREMANNKKSIFPTIFCVWALLCWAVTTTTSMCVFFRKGFQMKEI